MVYILIPIHNRWTETQQLLNCLEKQIFKDFQVIVVDGGSKDGSGRKIKKRYPETVVIPAEDKMFTNAINIGLKHILARAKRDDFVLFINQDCIVGKKYLEILVRTSLQNGRAIAGSVSPGRGGIKIDWKNFTLHQSWSKVDTLSTRGTLCPTEVIGKIGLFDEKNFPHYTSDYDFFLRAKKAGFKLVLSRKATVEHQSTRKNMSIWERLFSVRSAGNLSNTFRFNFKHAPTLWLKIWSCARYLLEFLK